MQRKHIPMEKMEEEIEDIAGIRIICQFEEDIDTVASIIRSRSDMTIKSEKTIWSISSKAVTGVIIWSFIIL